MKQILFVLSIGLALTISAQDTVSYDSILYKVKALGNNPVRYYYKGKPFTGTIYKGVAKNPLEYINVKDGKSYGYYLSYHHNGQLKVKEHYEFGRRDGESLRWHENGQMQHKMFYEQGHIKDTVWAWHSNGVLKKMSIEKPFAKYTVETNLWYPNGQLQLRVTSDYQESYHANGQLRVKGDLINYQCHGKFKYYDENGKVTKIIIWKNGKQKKVTEK